MKSLADPTEANTGKAWINIALSEMMFAKSKECDQAGFIPAVSH